MDEDDSRSPILLDASVKGMRKLRSKDGRCPIVTAETFNTSRF